jgi:hypothetical protein
MYPTLCAFKVRLPEPANFALEGGGAITARDARNICKLDLVGSVIEIDYRVMGSWR